VTALRCPPVPSVVVGDVEVAYGVEGTGDPVVLVHGTTGSRAHWLQQVPVIAASHTVVTPELPGSGETVDAGDPLDIDGVVQCVIAVADAEGFTRFHLAGWSLGAVVAAAVAASVPQRIRTLTLANGWATTDARMKFTFDLWKRLLERDRELFARYVLADGLGVESFELFGAGIEDLVPMTAEGFAPGSDRQLDLDIEIDISSRLTNIVAPTLVVGGTFDRWVDVEHSRKLAAAISGARLVELPCGHLVPTEQATTLNDLLLAHFANG